MLEDVEAFLSGLRHAWKEGEVRHTSRKKPPIPRGRRRPDPLVTVTEDLKEWFHEDPSQTGRELLGRLQAVHPDVYPDGLIRTVQCRLKIWRGDMARALVFGAYGSVHRLMIPQEHPWMRHTCVFSPRLSRYTLAGILNLRRVPWRITTLISHA